MIQLTRKEIVQSLINRGITDRDEIKRRADELERYQRDEVAKEMEQRTPRRTARYNHNRMIYELTNSFLGWRRNCNDLTGMIY